MALVPINERHLAQIKAGTVGRTRGHGFDKTLTSDLNALKCGPHLVDPLPPRTHLFRGHPAILLLRYIASRQRINRIKSIRAWWLGGLATAGEGDAVTDPKGRAIKASKSDVVIELVHGSG